MPHCFPFLQSNRFFQGERSMARPTFSRRQFLKAATLAAAGGALAACQPAAPVVSQPTEVPGQSAQPTATQAAAEGKPVEPTKPAPPEVSAEAITYWNGWGGTYTNQTWDQIQKTPEFQSLLNGQKFEIKGGLSADVFLTAVAGGTPPDGCSNVNYTDFVARDVVIPIDSMVATSSVVKKDVFLP